MKSTKERIQDYIIITIGTIIASFSVFFFLTPSHLAVGSISGLAVLIAKFVPMTVGTLLIIRNLPAAVRYFCGKGVHISNSVSVHSAANRDSDSGEILPEHAVIDGRSILGYAGIPVPLCTGSIPLVHEQRILRRTGCNHQNYE